METTTNSIAAYAANTPARGRFGMKNVASGRCPNFKPNRQLAGIEPAQNAIEFVALREKLQANTSLADPTKGLRSVASWETTSYTRITRITRTAADAQGNLIGNESEAGFNDIIYGSASGSRIQGLGGNDALARGAGFDYIVADVRANPNGALGENGDVARDVRKYLDIDSKLSRLYAGERSISTSKLPKYTCKTKNRSRTQVSRRKLAYRRQESLIVCYGKWSNQKQRIFLTARAAVGISFRAANYSRLASTAAQSKQVSS